MTIGDFIRKRPYLVWYTKEYSKLSAGAVVESVLNYGDFDDVRVLIGLLGKKRIARIFQKQVAAARTNYDPKIAQYFSRYFAANA